MAIEDGVAVRPERSLGSFAVLAPPATLALIGGITVAIYAVFVAPILYPYWSDAPAYIEAARSLLSGQPLLISVPFGYENETGIFRLWPPGYPVLIAALASFGLDPATAALWLTRFSVAILPLAVYWAVHRAIGRALAFATALLSFSAVGIFPYAHQVSSDPPFALVSVLSLGLLLRGLEQDREGEFSRLLVGTGLLTALAVCIRNSGIALILAEGATLAALWLAKDGSFAQLCRRGGSLALGFVTGLVPLLIWNLAAFGELMPYHMPPSTVGVERNIIDLTTALILDTLPMIRIGGRSAPFLAALFILGVIMVLSFAMLRLRAIHARSGQAPTRDISAERLHGAFLFAAAFYSLISACMVVAARSRYEWGEPIAVRHVAQFDWLFIAALLAAVTPWLIRRRAAIVVLGMAALALVGLRAWHFIDNGQRLARAHDEGRWQPRMISLALSQSPTAQRLVARIPAQCDIISNAAKVTQVSFQRRSRMVWYREIDMAMFADLRKPSVLIFVPMPNLDIQNLQPPGPGYRTIRDLVFVAFEDSACSPKP